MHARLSKKVTTTVGTAALLGLVAAGCAQSGANPVESGAGATPTPPANVATSATPAPTVATTVPVIPTWPLTGQVADAASLNIPVMAVKVDNSPQARPHAGINQADQVYELNVEGITRFMELFHSQQPDRIGPVRSARSSDIDLMGNLNRPLLVWSGGNPGVTQQVLDAQAANICIDLGHPSAAGVDFYRDNNGRVAPHNLYTSVPKLRADFTPGDSGPAKPMFTFAAPGTALPATAVDTPGMLIDFGLNVKVEYVWDAERNGWDRFQVDEAHSRAKSAFVDEAGTQVAPENVVILFLPYGQSEVDSRSPKALSVGDGDGIVMTQGKTINVHWHRGDATEGWNLTDAQTGADVSLTTGRTWVALPDQATDHATPIDQAGADALKAYRV